MFEKLGFKKSDNKVQKIYECTEVMNDGPTKVTIVFWLQKEEVSISCEDEYGDCTYEVFLSRICTEAIALKCKELGWR